MILVEHEDFVPTAAIVDNNMMAIGIMDQFI